jgi:hypothetical protein
MLVGGVVIDIRLQVQVRRVLRLDLIEEADELLMPVSLMHWPITLPSSTLTAANKVVVPWRL